MPPCPSHVACRRRRTALRRFAVRRHGLVVEVGLAFHADRAAVRSFDGAVHTRHVVVGRVVTRRLGGDTGARVVLLAVALPVFAVPRGFDIAVSAGGRVVALAVAVAAVGSVPDRTRTVCTGHRAVPITVSVRRTPVRVVVRTVDVRRVVPTGAVPRHAVRNVDAGAVRRRIRVHDRRRRRFLHDDLRHCIRRRTRRNFIDGVRHRGSGNPRTAR